jgi:hypothetical protein
MARDGADSYSLASILGQNLSSRIGFRSGQEGNTLPRRDTDLARLNAMTDEEVVAAALSDRMRTRSPPNNW